MIQLLWTITKGEPRETGEGKWYITCRDKNTIQKTCVCARTQAHGRFPILSFHYYYCYIMQILICILLCAV